MPKMPSKVQKSLACAVGGAFLALGSFAADPPAAKPSPGEADAYRLQARHTLEGEAAALRAHDEAWLRRSPADREQAQAPVREKAEQESADLITAASRAEAAAPAADPCPLRGVRYPDREPAVDVPFHAWEFRVLDYWGGLVKDECTGVYAGYDPANPLQGELVVYSHPDDPSRFEVYPAPKATGPVRIVAEANGSLILSSVRGTFDRDTGAANPDGSTFEAVEAPGGGSYVFDLRTMRYR